MKRLLLALVVLVLLPAGAASAKTYKAPFVVTGLGWCSIKAGGGIGCASPAIPAYTDGYAYIHRRGRTAYGDTGDLISPAWVNPVNPPHLRRGDVWRKRGVTCVQRRGIKCWNRGGHGFKLTRSNYRDW